MCVVFSHPIRLVSLMYSAGRKLTQRKRLLVWYNSAWNCVQRDPFPHCCDWCSIMCLGFADVFIPLHSWVGASAWIGKQTRGSSRWIKRKCLDYRYSAVVWGSNMLTHIQTLNHVNDVVCFARKKFRTNGFSKGNWRNSRLTHLALKYSAFAHENAIHQNAW